MSWGNKILFVTWVSIMFFTSCSECKHENLGSLEFTSQDKAIIPYLGYDTIMLKDSVGNVSRFISGKRTDDFWEFAPDDDCPYSYYMIEHNFISFYASDNIRISFETTFDGNNKDLKAFIISAVGFPPGSSNWVKSYFQGDSIFSISSPEHVVFYPELTLINNSYKDVFEILVNEDTTYNKILNYYYTVKYGLVGIKSIYSEVWSVDTSDLR